MFSLSIVVVLCLEGCLVEDIQLAYTYQDTGKTVILLINQALWMGLGHKTLLNQNQIRYGGHRVYDDPTRRQEGFGIYFNENDGNRPIPFEMKGVNIHFNTHVPTDDEIANCVKISLTDDAPWNPDRVVINNLTLAGTKARDVSVCGIIVSDVLDDGHFGNALTSSIHYHAAPLPLSSQDAIDGAACVAAIGVTKERHSKVSPERVSQIFGCGLDTAKQTLKTTTQDGVRTGAHPLARRYRQGWLAQNRRRLNTKMYTDTTFAKYPSLQGNTCAQIYTDGHFVRVAPMRGSKSTDISETLTELCADVRIPEDMMCDLAAAQTGHDTAFQAECRRLKIQLHYSEKKRHAQMGVLDGEVKELKKIWRNKMVQKRVPYRLWDYGLVWIADVRSRTARGRDGRPGLERLLGQTIDISEYIDFDFYDLVWYWTDQDPNNEKLGRRVGRWLGISHRVGGDLTYWILTNSGHVVANLTVQHLTHMDLREDSARELVKAHDDRIAHLCLTDDLPILENEYGNQFRLDDIEEAYYQQQIPDAAVPADDEYGDMLWDEKPEVDDYRELGVDDYINSELLITRQDGTQENVCIVRCRLDMDENPVGRYHSNPLLDRREYVGVLPDGTEDIFLANTIAENLYSQVDCEGRTHLVFQEIIGHKKEADAIEIADGYEVGRNGDRKPKRMTRGWKLLVQFKGGVSEYVPLKILKDTNPVELAEYAVAHSLTEEPAFKWWVPLVLRKRSRIISKVKSRYWRTTHKYGIKLPKTVEEALAIDAATGTDFWRRALEKELRKIMVAFEFHPNWTPQQVHDGLACGDFVGFQEISCHIVFDVKMDLTRKARFVAGGHTTETPDVGIYSSVVSRDSIRIAFTIAALNDLEVLACDVGNAYLNAPCREKIWFVAGAEFGDRQGQVVKIVRALYGLKSSGAAWRQMLKDMVEGDLKFCNTRADSDVYIRRATDSEGNHYYEYVLIYVDDILIISKKPDEILEPIKAQFELKPESIKPPERYLGADVECAYSLGNRTCMTMSPDTYLKQAVKNLEHMLETEDKSTLAKELNVDPRKLTKIHAPIQYNYQPELDTTPELNDHLASRYAQLIGVLRWGVELGRVDIYFETAILSQHLALPRMGHLKQVYHIFAYLKSYPKCKMIFDPVNPANIDETAFQHGVDWSDIYGDVKEELPPDMPEELGAPVTIHCFVDAAHAGNMITRRSHTGIIIYINNSPIMWYSKRQATVEASTFGSELVALRIAKVMIMIISILRREC